MDPLASRQIQRQASDSFLCVPHLPGYQCNCLSQFTGRNCELEITACFPNPCRNGGSCDPIGNAFICNCKNGLTGVT